MSNHRPSSTIRGSQVSTKNGPSLEFESSTRNRLFHRSFQVSQEAPRMHKNFQLSTLRDEHNLPRPLTLFRSTASQVKTTECHFGSCCCTFPMQIRTSLCPQHKSTQYPDGWTGRDANSTKKMQRVNYHSSSSSQFPLPSDLSDSSLVSGSTTRLAL